MTNSGLWLLFDLLILVIALGGVGLYLYARASKRAVLAARLRNELKRRGRQDEKKDTGRAQTMGGAAIQLLHSMGGIAPLFSQAQRLEVGQKLVMAGWRSPQALLVMAGLCGLTGTLLVGLTVTLIWPILDERTLYRVGSGFFAFYVGMLLPRMVLDRIVAHRHKAIERSLPDALDLLVICTNAGLALNAALQRVAEEMASVAPALAEELQLTSSEMQLSSDPSVALERFAERTQLASVRSLVSTLIQSRQYGTAITQALRVLARTERNARLMRLEEAAAKLAVKITMPMMFFILPTVLIVAAGPAVLNMIEFFSNQ